MECCKYIIRNAATTALGNVADSLVEKLVRVLTEEIGVESKEDLMLLKENDLVPLLKPIQARKLLIQLQKETPDEIPKLQISAPAPKVSLPVSPAAKVNISWHKMPKLLMTALKNKSTPSPLLRREMIRILATDILESTSSPNRKLCREVAKQIVTLYPESFLDKVCGQVLSNGYESLTNQLTNRCENFRRQLARMKTNYEKKNPNSPPSAPACKRTIVDSYGCVKWNPLLPLENMESLIKKKEMMKQLDVDFHLGKTLLEDTFCLQRSEINEGSHISELLEGWPKLFTAVGLHQHFKLLTDINLEEKLAVFLDTKKSDFWRFLKSLQNEKLAAIITTVEVKTEDVTINEVVALLQAIATYFDEDISKFILTSEVWDPHNMEHLQLPEAPCLVAIGTDKLTAYRYMLIIDKIVVNSNLSRISAITCFFASYFIFNIRYPDELKITLEFMQRCVFGINPAGGCKVKRKKGKLYQSTHKSIVSLSLKMQHFSSSDEQ